MRIETNAPSRWALFWVFGALLVTAWLVYGGNQDHRLLHWDDITYVSSNRWVTHPSWDFLKEIFTRSRLANWHPLTWLSYIPEYQLCGERASCYKATNITLHALNAFLVFYLSRLVLTLSVAAPTESAKKIAGASLIASMLFVVHPQHVESVIWVAERKDLLCAAFYMLSIIFYLRRHSTPGAPASSLPYLFFALAALSKSMAVTLPAVLIILDLAPLGRFRGADWRRVVRIAVVEKMHFHLTAALLVLVTLLTQKVDTIAPPELSERLLLSISAMHHYITTFFVPADLSPFYPAGLVFLQPKALLLLFAAAMACAAVAGTARFGSRFVAWLAYFLVTLAPVIGIVKVGEQAFADRYTYLPMIGFYLVIGWGLVSLPIRSKFGKAALIASTTTALLVLGMLSRDYKEVWRSDMSLWQHVAARYAGLSATVHNNLGNSYAQSRQYENALAEGHKAIVLDPRRVDIYGNMGRTLEFLKQPDRAMHIYARGIKNNPGSALAYIQAGLGQERLGRPGRALILFEAALAREPDNSYALFGVGKNALITGSSARAIVVLPRIQPDSLMHLDAQLLMAQAYIPTDKRRALEILASVERRHGPLAEVSVIRARIK